MYLSGGFVMHTMSAKQAREQFRALVDAAARGETTIITRRGRQVARIDPIAAESGRKLPDLSEFRSSLCLKGRGLSATVIALRAEERG
jgi:prevent-host-death family protein